MLAVPALNKCQVTLADLCKEGPSLYEDSACDSLDQRAGIHLADVTFKSSLAGLLRVLKHPTVVQAATKASLTSDGRWTDVSYGHASKDTYSAGTEQ
jgi:hypothetical protein